MSCNKQRKLDDECYESWEMGELLYCGCPRVKAEGKKDARQIEQLKAPLINILMVTMNQLNS